jgi:hypothetical protein
MELPRGGSFYGGKLVWCMRLCSDLSVLLLLLMMPMLSVCVHAAAALYLYQIPNGFHVEKKNLQIEVCFFLELARES